jgi:endonuclease IV
LDLLKNWYPYVKKSNTCKLCIDFAHIHARYNGKLKGYNDFAEILQYVYYELGKPALEDLLFILEGYTTMKKASNTTCRYYKVISTMSIALKQ